MRYFFLIAFFIMTLMESFCSFDMFWHKNYLLGAIFGFFTVCASTMTGSVIANWKIIK